MRLNAVGHAEPARTPKWKVGDYDGKDEPVDGVAVRRSRT
jgi:hypothetical protein